MKKTTGTDRSITSKWRPATRAVRAGTWRCEQGETSEALFLTSGYTYDDAETVAARFAGEQAGMTVFALPEPDRRDAAGADRGDGRGRGVPRPGQRDGGDDRGAAVQLSQGDHVVAGRAAFGSCRWITRQRAHSLRHRHSAVDGRDNAAWEAAIRPNTKVFFFETPANPTMDMVDLEFVCGLARANGHHQRWSTTPSPPRAAAPARIRRRRRRLFGDQADGRAGPGAGRRGLRQRAN